jgi:type IX secretion system PorP/SprF family membrane protein
MYAYQKNIRKDLAFSAALQVDVEQKILNSNSFEMGDRINPRTGYNPSLPGENIASTTKTYPDFSAGALVYGNNYQVGFSAHHLLQPNQSFLGGQSLLPNKFSAHAGLIIPLPGEKKLPRYARIESYISPQIIYQQQRDFKELNLGFYFKKGVLTGGFWYRTRDAIILSVGIQKSNLRFGYSYDVTLSKLGASTLGSHELAVGYRFKCPKKISRVKFLPCPGFD